MEAANFSIWLPASFHVHGARGVRGHELHHEALPVPLVHAAVILPLLRDGLQHVRVPGRGEAEVDKAGARHLHGGKPAPREIQVIFQRLRDLAGGHVQGAGPGHGVVRGVVAVLGVLGDLHRAAERGPRGEQALCGGLFAGGGEQGVDAVLRVLDHVSHGLCLSLLVSVLSRSAGNGSGWQRRAPCPSRSRSPCGRRAR